jgi:hypothetical protein
MTCLAAHRKDGTRKRLFLGNVSHSNEYGNSLVTGLFKPTSTVTHRLKKQNL